MQPLRQGTYLRNRREEMLPFVPPAARRVLDVGCACGDFASLVRERTGANVWGVELNPDAAAIAASRIDRVIAKDAFAALSELEGERFDCIVFNDVLEHLVDPYLVLARVKGLLSSDGRVVASLPNLRHHSVLAALLLRGDFDYACDGILDRTHLRFFTKRSIRKAFVGLGYDVEISGLPPPPSRLDAIASLLPDRFQDIRFVQFACVARPSR